MYMAIIAGRPRTDALMAAARHVLDDLDLAFFEKVMAFFRGVAKRRNDVVHNLWAESSKVPNALLLVEPALSHLLHRDLEALRHKAMKNAGDLKIEDYKHIKPDTSRIMVYTKASFERLKRDIGEAHSLVFAFSQFFDPRFGRELGRLIVRDALEKAGLIPKEQTFAALEERLLRRHPEGKPAKRRKAD